MGKTKNRVALAILAVLAIAYAAYADNAAPQGVSALRNDLVATYAEAFNN